MACHHIPGVRCDECRTANIPYMQAMQIGELAAAQAEIKILRDELGSLKELNKKLSDALKGVLPMAEAWFRREFDGYCDHEDGECTCDNEARTREVIINAKNILNSEL